MDKKKKTNWFKIILIALFVIYMSLYSLNASGYYDGSMRRKVEFTEEQIKEFEQDIADGKNVEIKDYLKDQNRDYTNGVSRIGYSISTKVNTFFNKGIKEFVKILSKLLS